MSKIQNVVAFLMRQTLIIVIGVIVIIAFLYQLGVWDKKEAVLTTSTQSAPAHTLAPSVLTSYKKIELHLTEEWQTIFLTAGESIHVWGNQNVIGQSEGDSWIEYKPSTPNLYGVSYWYKFRAKEGTGRMKYCVYPKGKNPQVVCID